MPFLNTRKQLLVADKNIGIQEQSKDFWTPHVTRSTMVPSFCKSKLALTSSTIRYKILEGEIFGEIAHGRNWEIIFWEFLANAYKLFNASK